MTLRALNALLVLAYRKARRGGGVAWWAVVALAWLIVRSERRAGPSTRFALRPGEDVSVAVRERDR